MLQTLPQGLLLKTVLLPVRTGQCLGGRRKISNVSSHRCRFCLPDIS